jgi:ribosomal protein S18 acetylase RimI-like enzyme
MKYFPEFSMYDETLELVEYSPNFKIGEFQCKDPDYSNWLIKDAQKYINLNISRVVLLIDKNNQEIIGYMALCTDSFKLSKEEKEKARLKRIKIESVPALKIGKLAIDCRYERKKFGFYLLWLALAIAANLNNNNTACRFLVVDADVSEDQRTIEFYRKAGFKENQAVNKEKIEKYGNELKNISMRYDILFNEEQI